MTVYQLKNTTIFTVNNLKSFWPIGKKSKEFFNFFSFFTDASLSRTGKCRSRVAAVLNTYKVKEVCEEEASRKLNFTSYVKIVIDGWKKKNKEMVFWHALLSTAVHQHYNQSWCANLMYLLCQKCTPRDSIWKELNNCFDVSIQCKRI